MEQLAEEFIKPNDRLTSFERLQLYGRMYWFRLYDAIRDDCPGLMAALGESGSGAWRRPTWQSVPPARSPFGT